MKNLKKYKSHIINIGIVILISLIATFYYAGGSSSTVAIVLNIVYGLIIGFSIAFGCHFVTQFFFKEDRFKKKPVRNFTFLVIAIAVFIFLNVIGINLIWFKLTQDRSFSEIMNSRMVRSTITVEFVIGFTVYLIRLAQVFARFMKDYYEELSEIRNELAKYKYETLKNQMNPHFLFNTLNTLSGLIYQDVNKSDEFIHHFAQIYRYVLDVQHEDVVKIEDELGFIEHFLFLNNIRFDDAIHAKINILDKEQYVVPMALQIAVENAIKHNQFNRQEPLHIEIREEGEFIEISNNKNIKEQTEPSNQIGISNLQARYLVLNDNHVKLEETQSTFTLYLPILRNAN